MSVPSWARKGARVVCVDANWSSIPAARPLEPLGVYTILDAFECDRGIGGEHWLYLEEVINPIDPGWGFHLDRFRPLVEDSESDGIEAQIFRSKAKTNHSRNPREREAA